MPVCCLMMGVLLMGTAQAQERQLTFSAKNHDLDNNDNFSPGGHYLCYDTREFIGPGIENSDAIEMVELATGKETLLYRPETTITGTGAAPGVGAVSFSPVAMEVAFIHGPPVEQVPTRGYYGKPNRNGASVPADGTGKRTWLDFRDVATDRPTTPGAHRGGTHRHEYARDGRRIGFTYDDFLLPQYDRTIGYLERHPKAPGGASHWFAILVAVVPKGQAKPDEIERAWGDSWVDRAGTMRAFIGNVREPDGTYAQSLFVVDIPPDVDITTANAGSAAQFPTPPGGVHVRRLTQDYAEGIVRGSYDGTRIAYYGKDAEGRLQLYVIPADGSSGGTQVTRFETGAGPGLRWHPSDTALFCTSENAIVATCVEKGARFGKSTWLTERGGPERKNLVVSPDGRLIAYNRTAPTRNAEGKPVKTYAGADPLQIFLVDTGIPEACLRSESPTEDEG